MCPQRRANRGQAVPGEDLADCREDRLAAGILDFLNGECGSRRHRGTSTQLRLTDQSNNNSAPFLVKCPR
jgi:hypothetical protein